MPDCLSLSSSEKNCRILMSKPNLPTTLEIRKIENPNATNP